MVQTLVHACFCWKTQQHYETFNLLGKEFTFDVDVANLPCGLNGALFFSQMQAAGGKSEFTNNKAGAEYGVGYCDSQCPRDLKFIDGEVCGHISLFYVFRH